MRNSLRFIAAFLSVILLGEGVARGAAARIGTTASWPNPVLDQRVMLVDSAGARDVVFVGSSVVASAVRPSVVLADSDRSGLNIALAGASPRTLDPYLEYVALPKICPGVIVLGVSIRDWNDNFAGAAEYLREFESSRGFRETSGELSSGDRLEVEIGSVSSLVGIRSYLTRPKDFANSLKWAGARPVTEDGLDLAFYGSMKDVEPGPDPELMSGAFYDFSVGQVEEAAVRSIYQHATEQGIQLIIVDMPTLRLDLVESLPNGHDDWLAYRESVAQMVSDLDVEYVDLADLITDRSMFSDAYHLNASGALLTSEALGKELLPLIASAPQACAP